jgi:hypothetical protein
MTPPCSDLESRGEQKTPKSGKTKPVKLFISSGFSGNQISGFSGQCHRHTQDYPATENQSRSWAVPEKFWADPPQPFDNGEWQYQTRFRLLLIFLFLAAVCATPLPSQLRRYWYVHPLIFEGFLILSLPTRSSSMSSSFKQEHIFMTRLIHLICHAKLCKCQSRKYCAVASGMIAAFPPSG